MSNRRTLRLDRVQSTIDQLQFRVSERFSGSGLAALVGELAVVAREVNRDAASISRHVWWVWLLIVSTVGLFGGVIIHLASSVKSSDGQTWTELAQGVESISSECVLLIGLVIFLATWQTRIRRNRVVAAVRQLRELAHIVDMLQLTKDPSGIAGVSLPSTAHSPRRDLTQAELARYLDYCSELLSLIAKVAQFYVANFDDPVATAAVNQLEDLTDGLSRKIWQKIMIIHQAPRAPQPS